MTLFDFAPLGVLGVLAVPSPNPARADHGAGGASPIGSRRAVSVAPPLNTRLPCTVDSRCPRSRGLAHSSSALRLSASSAHSQRREHSAAQAARPLPIFSPPLLGRRDGPHHHSQARRQVEDCHRRRPQIRTDGVALGHAGHDSRLVLGSSCSVRIAPSPCPGGARVRDGAGTTVGHPGRVKPSRALDGVVEGVDL